MTIEDAATRKKHENEDEMHDEENALTRGQTQSSPRESSRTAGEDGGTQSASQHAEGPWRCEINSRGQWEIFAASQAMICRLAKWAPTMDEADARLMTAAPELLEACDELIVAVSAAMRVIADLDTMKHLGAEADTREQRFVDELRIAGVENGFGVRAKAAIAKATGR